MLPLCRSRSSPSRHLRMAYAIAGREGQTWRAGGLESHAHVDAAGPAPQLAETQPPVEALCPHVPLAHPQVNARRALPAQRLQEGLHQAATLPAPLGMGKKVDVEVGGV